MRTSAHLLRISHAHTARAKFKVMRTPATARGSEASQSPHAGLGLARPLPPRPANTVPFNVTM